VFNIAGRIPYQERTTASGATASVGQISGRRNPPKRNPNWRITRANPPYALYEDFCQESAPIKIAMRTARLNKLAT